MLDLSGNKLLFLPPEIAELENLVKLAACKNELKGLPAEIHKLQKLKKLELSHNMISKIPPEVGRITTLTLLDIENNNLLFPPRHVTSKGHDEVMKFLVKADKGKIKIGRFATETKDTN